MKYLKRKRETELLKRSKKRNIEEKCSETTEAHQCKCGQQIDFPWDYVKTGNLSVA